MKVYVRLFATAGAYVVLVITIEIRNVCDDGNDIVITQCHWQWGHLIDHNGLLYLSCSLPVRYLNYKLGIYVRELDLEQSFSSNAIIER